MTPNRQRQAHEYLELKQRGFSFAEVAAMKGLTPAAVTGCVAELRAELKRIHGPQHLVAHNAALSVRARWILRNVGVASLFDLPSLQPSPEAYLMRTPCCGGKTVKEIMAARAAVVAGMKAAE